MCACPNPILNRIITCCSRFKHVIIVPSRLCVVVYTRCRIYTSRRIYIHDATCVYMLLHTYTCRRIYIHDATFVLARYIYIHAIAFIYMPLHLYICRYIYIHAVTSVYIPSHLYTCRPIYYKCSCVYIHAGIYTYHSLHLQVCTKNILLTQTAPHIRLPRARILTKTGLIILHTSETNN